MVRLSVRHVFPTKRAASKFRSKLLKKGHAVGKVTAINERAGKRTYRARFDASKNPVR